MTELENDGHDDGDRPEDASGTGACTGTGVAVALSALTLAACGGGGGGSSTPPPTQNPPPPPPVVPPPVTITDAEAARFLVGWVPGRTYDGYWDPDYPWSVFFEKADPEREAATIRALQFSAPCLIIAGFLLARRRRSTTA